MLGWLREAAMVVLGIVLAAIPLALWVAWSLPLFYACITVFAVALLALVVIERTAPRGGTPAAPDKAMKQVSVNEFIDEIERVMPYTSPHGRAGDARARRQMAKLRRIIGLPDE